MHAVFLCGDITHQYCTAFACEDQATYKSQDVFYGEHGGGSQWMTQHNVAEFQGPSPFRWHLQSDMPSTELMGLAPSADCDQVY